MFLDVNRSSGKTEINKEFKENLFQIIRQYGNEIFEKNLLYPYMTDYFPREKEFLMVMKTTYEDGVYTKLASLYNNCGNDRNRMKKLMEEEVRRLKSKFLWSEEIAKFCIEIFENAGDELSAERADSKKIEKADSYSGGATYTKILKYKSVMVEIGIGFRLTGSKIERIDAMPAPYIILIKAPNGKEKFSDKNYQEIQKFLIKSRTPFPGKNILVLSDGELKRELLLADTGIRDSQAFAECLELGRSIWVLSNVRFVYLDQEKMVQVVGDNALDMVACFTGGRVIQVDDISSQNMELYEGTADVAGVVFRNRLYILSGHGRDEDIKMAIARCSERINADPIYGEILENLEFANEDNRLHQRIVRKIYDISKSSVGSKEG